jgi:hypothetical protein
MHLRASSVESNVQSSQFPTRRVEHIGALGVSMPSGQIPEISQKLQRMTEEEIRRWVRRACQAPWGLKQLQQVEMVLL